MASKQITEQIILKVKVDSKSAEAGLDKFHKKVKPIEKSINKTGKAVNNFGKESEKASKKVGLLGKAMQGIGAAIIISKLQSMAKEAITVSREFERIGLAMNTVFGASAGEQMAFITSEADRLGISLSVSAQGFSQLAASTKSVLTLKQTKELFTATAEASTAMGLSIDRTKSIFRALTQIASKGTVSSEELKQQMGEHLPGAFKLAADSMGVTTQELTKMLDKGELMAKEFLPRFAKELSKTYHEGALKNANSEIAQHNRNLTAWETHLKGVGDELKTVTTPATGLLLSGLDGLNDMIADGIIKVFGYKLSLAALGEGTKNATAKTIDFNKELNESNKALTKVKTATDLLFESFANDIKMDIRFEDVRLALGLTEQGFAKIRKEVEALGKETDSTYELVAASEELLKILKETKQLKEGDLIKDKDLEKAKMIAKQLRDASDVRFSIKGFKDSDIRTEGFNQKTESDFNPNARVPSAGIQTGTAEAAAFLVRPMKEADKIAKDSLDVQKKIEKNTAKAAENKVQLFSIGMS